MPDKRDSIHHYRNYTNSEYVFKMLDVCCPRSHPSLLWSAQGACVRDLFGITVTSYPVWNKSI